MPASASVEAVIYAIPGVGRTPARYASAPMEQIPDTRAYSSI